RSPEQETATSEPEKIQEVETFPDSEEIPAKQPTSEQPIPEQTPEQLLVNTVI
ncbi:hypothetical protein A2U01_0094224, partial [Trifolium medium]|nr:hypothetical protein [Trifolium medium]